MQSWAGKLLVFVFSAAAVHAAALQSQPSNSLAQRPVDESEAVTLLGNVHPLAQRQFDEGTVGAETRLERMILELCAAPAQQRALDALGAAQHDPASPEFHRWLTPAEFGARFGASQAALNRVTGWLTSHGFTINEIPAGRRLILFSGTAGQVEEAFHTAIHRYRVNGAEHIANAEDPQIPKELAGIVGGVVSLHDFRRVPQIASRRKPGAEPEYSSGSTHYLFPADYAVIYDLNSLYNAGTNGSGVSIAIVGRSDINLSDVASFRTYSGLSANAPQVIRAGADPGIVSGDQDESTLDVEWAGATAPAATVEFEPAASTQTSDGVDLSAAYIVNHANATVMSTSYGSCEQSMGATELAFYNSLWQQAASEGISAFVSSGDSGASGCDGGSSSRGTQQAVNGLCSSPYSTCVGGTEFNEGSNAAQYWSSTNSSAYGSALSYIPEMVWNESASNGGSGLWASGGGISQVYAQPTWQQNVAGASATNGMRGVPDVALTAAGHDGYIICEDGSLYVIAGTSAASPSFAGIMALVVQANGGAGQGNANPGLYPLINAASNPFHATPSGNNTVPGVSGYTASGVTYNLATGLGSVDGAVLVSSWGHGGAAQVDFTLSESAPSATVQRGNSTTVTLSVAGTGAFKKATLTFSAPSGVVVTAPASITSGAAAKITIAAGASAAGGAQNVVFNAYDSTGSQTATFALTVTLPPSLTLSAPSSSIAITQGQSGAATFTAATGGTFSGSINMALTGLPAGVTAAWNPASITPSGTSSNSMTLTLAVAASVRVGSYALQVTAAGDGLKAASQLALQVNPAPGITVAASPSSISMMSMGIATMTLTATPIGGATVPANASGATAAVVSGLPSGITAQWSAPSVSAAGAVAWTLTLTGSLSAKAAKNSLALSVQVTDANTNAVYSAAPVVALTVQLTPPTLGFAPPSSGPLSSPLQVVQGTSGSASFTINTGGSFTGSIALTTGTLPSGVTASWSGNPITASGTSTNTATLTLAVPLSLPVGSYAIVVTAAGDGVKASQTLTLQVTWAPGIAVTPSPASIAMMSMGTAAMTVTAVPVGGAVLPANASGTSVAVASGLPAGVTAQWSAPSVSNAGAVSWTLTLTGSLAAAASRSTLAISAHAIDANTASAYTTGLSVPLTVQLTPPTLAVSGSTGMQLTQGSTATNTLSLAAGGSYQGAVTLTVSRLPAGVTASWSANPVTLASNAGSSVLTLSATSSATAGAAQVTVTATGGGVSAVARINLQVQYAPALQASLQRTALTMTHNLFTSVALNTSAVGGLSVTVAPTVNGLPQGVTAAFSPSTIAAPGTGSTTLTFTGSAQAATGLSSLTVTATGTDASGNTYTVALPLTLRLQ